jgi:clan AA aspartic protease
MIKGSINSTLEATLRLTLRGPHGQRRRITAVIDTGFNGALTLPLAVIMELGFPWMESGKVELGDGSIGDCHSYAGVVIWDRLPINILVDEADTTPLVGMALLQGFELKMNVERRGQVTIKPLRRRRTG